MALTGTVSMDLYERRVVQEMATEAGLACIWFVVRHRLLSSPDEERLIADDPLRADELAARRVKAMCASARHRTGAEARAFVRAQMIEHARLGFSTTEILTLNPGFLATSLLDGFERGAWQ
jgi:hypothetical protein